MGLSIVNFETRELAQAEADWLTTFGYPAHAGRLVASAGGDFETDQAVADAVAREPYGVFLDDDDRSLWLQVRGIYKVYLWDSCRVPKELSVEQFRHDLYSYYLAGGILKVMEPVTQFPLNLGTKAGDPRVAIYSNGDPVVKDGRAIYDPQTRLSVWNWTDEWIAADGIVSKMSSPPPAIPDHACPESLTAEQVVNIAMAYVPIGQFANFKVLFPHGGSLSCHYSRGERSIYVRPSHFNHGNEFESLDQVALFEPVRLKSSSYGETLLFANQSISDFR